MLRVCLPVASGSFRFHSTPFGINFIRHVQRANNFNFLYILIIRDYISVYRRNEWHRISIISISVYRIDALTFSWLKLITFTVPHAVKRKEISPEFQNFQSFLKAFKTQGHCSFLPDKQSFSFKSFIFVVVILEGPLKCVHFVIDCNQSLLHFLLFQKQDDDARHHENHHNYIQNAAKNLREALFQLMFLFILIHDWCR